MRLTRSWLLGVLWLCAAQAGLAADDTAISIEGAPRGVLATLRAYLEEGDLDCTDHSRGKRREIQVVSRDALDALGFFAATTRLEFLPDGGCVLTVNAGARVPLTVWEVSFPQVTEEQSPMAAARELLPDLPTPFDPQAYNAIKQNFLTALNDGGYLDARFLQAEVDVDLERNVAAVQWQLDAGPRYVIAPLEIDQKVLNDALMRRFIEFEEGDYLVNRRLLETYDNLISSDYFAGVRVTPRLEQRADGKVPVKISATPAPQWSYLAGPGFATDTGPRVRGEANARYLNPAGHRIALTSMLSPVAGNLKAEYRWPFGHPKDEWYGVEARYNYEDTDTANSDTVGLGIRRTSRISRHWTQTTYADYRVEDFDVADQEGRSELLLLGANFSFTSAIDAPRPRSGRRLSIDLRGGSESLLSDNDVLQLRLSAKQILPFIGQSRLLLRAEAGFSWQDDFAELPASMRFFVGGDRSVRGYALESLGEEDENGEVIGGDRLYVGSIEIDVPVRQKWSLAFFTDIGTAFLDGPDFSQSVGLGVRWYSPLGPIRVDLAHPMQNSDQPVRLHISLGPDI